MVNIMMETLLRINIMLLVKIIKRGKEYAEDMLKILKDNIFIYEKYL